MPLRVQLSPNSQVVDVGRSATLRCLLSGVPLPSITWYKDGQRLEPEVELRETLRIPSVRPEDAGMYQCIASNDLHTAQDSAQLRLGCRQTISHHALLLIYKFFFF